MRMNDPYMPNPTSTATTFVVHAPRMRITSMSTSGSRARVSPPPQSAPPATPARMRPIVLGEPQPHVEVSLTPTSTDTRATASRLAPAQSTRPGDLIGDSGTHRHV